METTRLAIIIPYFKNEFFESTLESLSLQTCKNFTVYIGDDYSPNPIDGILEKFSDTLTIKYHRFEENLGSVSLTKQWERCVGLSIEEWIWLFSDDDIIEKYAVENFYKSLNEKDLLYKFHTKVIDEKGNLNPYFTKFDQLNNINNYLSSDKFLELRLKASGFRSFAVEYIFHRSLFLKIGFIDFPLAWNSDDATWLAYSIANNQNIKIVNSYVYWRLSTSNITSDIKSIATIKQKVEASILYIKWLHQMSSKYSLHVPKHLVLKWFSIQIGIFMPNLTIKDFYKLLCRIPYSFNYIFSSYSFLRYVKFQGIKRMLQVLLKK